MRTFNPHSQRLLLSTILMVIIGSLTISKIVIAAEKNALNPQESIDQNSNSNSNSASTQETDNLSLFDLSEQLIAQEHPSHAVFWLFSENRGLMLKHRNHHSITYGNLLMISSHYPNARQSRTLIPLIAQLNNLGWHCFELFRLSQPITNEKAESKTSTPQSEPSTPAGRKESKIQKALTKISEQTSDELFLVLESNDAKQIFTLETSGRSQLSGIIFLQPTFDSSNEEQINQILQLEIPLFVVYSPESKNQLSFFLNKIRAQNHIPHRIIKKKSLDNNDNLVFISRTIHGWLKKLTSKNPL